MQANRLQGYKRTLLEIRERLRDEARSRAETLPEKMQPPGDVSDLPTHTADHDVEGLNSEVAAGEVQKRELDAIAAALERIDAGTFGQCVQCGGQISPSRLEALPYAETCAACEHEAQST